MRVKEVMYRRTDRYSVWVGFDEEKKEYVAEVFLKVIGGIKHALLRHKKYSLHGLLDHMKQVKYISPRPYKLAQPCDGSIDSPVWVLFCRFCKAFGISPVELYKAAYPSDPVMDFETSVEFGLWQTVDCPENWNKRDFEGLLESLSEINNHSLREVLEQRVELLGVFLNDSEIIGINLSLN